MESFSPDKGNIIKDIINLSGLKKEKNYTAITNIRNPFRPKKEIEGIKEKDSTLKYLESFEYEKEEENYCHAARVNSFWSNSYIEHKINGYNNKTVSVE